MCWYQLDTEDVAPGGNNGDDNDETGHCPLWIWVRWDFHARCQAEWVVACLRSTFGWRRTFLYTANSGHPLSTFGGFSQVKLNPFLHFWNQISFLWWVLISPVMMTVCVNDLQDCEAKNWSSAGLRSREWRSRYLVIEPWARRGNQALLPGSPLAPIRLLPPTFIIQLF